MTAAADLKVGPGRLWRVPRPIGAPRVTIRRMRGRTTPGSLRDPWWRITCPGCPHPGYPDRRMSLFARTFEAAVARADRHVRRMYPAPVVALPTVHVPTAVSVPLHGQWIAT